MASETESARPSPKVFIPYSWDSETHKQWVRAFGTRLRADGVDVTLDQWHLQPGDQLPVFMERAIRENDYVLPICTPRYAERSNQRLGGAGYEGDIMTAEVYTTGNQRKFIPIFRVGADWRAAAPTWLLGKWPIDLRGDPFSEVQYQDLLTTLHGTRPIAPPLVRRPTGSRPQAAVGGESEPKIFAALKIVGIVVDEVTIPRNDGTRGSALYRIPFQLSRRPSPDWSSVFVKKWDHPSSYTLMHRPGIASVIGDKIVLNGTTIDEVEKTHRKTLLLALEETNCLIEEQERHEFERELAKLRRTQEHERQVREGAERIKFE